MSQIFSSPDWSCCCVCRRGSAWDVFSLARSGTSLTRVVYNAHINTAHEPVACKATKVTSKYFSVASKRRSRRISLVPPTWPIHHSAWQSSLCANAHIDGAPAPIVWAASLFHAKAETLSRVTLIFHAPITITHLYIYF
jgi:hypothetical protein